MKSFKEYLTESKKTYEFKIKIADDLEASKIDDIKEALDQYKVERCSAGNRSPIQENPLDFPDHKNVNVCNFDVTLAYPVTSLLVKDAISKKLGLSHSCIKVLNLKEEEEEEINHQYDTISGESILGKDYELDGAQADVGGTKLMSLLKDLSNSKHQPKQYTGVNDEILAKSVPTYKDGPATKEGKSKDFSVIGGKKVKLPTAKTAGDKK